MRYVAVSIAARAQVTLDQDWRNCSSACRHVMPLHSARYATNYPTRSTSSPVKAELQQLNGQVPPLSVIARTSDSILYRTKSNPALLLLDYDQKGMPPEVKQRVAVAGGLLAALQSLLPQLNDVGSLWRPSTSSGLYRGDTQDRIQGSGGLHGYVGIVDGSDAVRALKDYLHDRCHGWLKATGG